MRMEVSNVDNIVHVLMVVSVSAYGCAFRIRSSLGSTAPSVHDSHPNHPGSCACLS